MTLPDPIQWHVSTDGLSFYAMPGLMTDLVSCPSRLFDDLPDRPDALCHVVQGLLVHEEWASTYGFDIPEGRLREVQTRPAAEIIRRILSLNPARLVEGRPPEQRMIGNCRHFATLSTALLRRAGIPARARCGFASYFEPDRMVDHWITEYRVDGGWKRLDAQLDGTQREVLKVSFDPDDLPSEVFLAAGEGWQRCRSGSDNPSRYGIFDMWGLWFICSNVIRDLAALNKMELLPWDSWGPMAFRQDPDAEQSLLIDRIAATIAEDSQQRIRNLYHGERGMAVGDEIFDARFFETCRLNIPVGG